jgi:hypothetical protein
MQITDFLVIGDVYIINNETQAAEFDKPAAKPLPNIPQTVKNITSFKDKLKNDVTETVKPGIIRRPTAGELLAKDEPEIKKEADAAIKETLDQIPELREAKKLLEEQKKQ